MAKDPFGKTPGLKKPAFGGKPKTGAKPPDKKTLESFGGARTKQKPFEASVPGNKEFGFIQATPKQATGAMMGRPPPKSTGSKSSGPARKDAKRAFKKTPGAKVF